MTSLPGPANRAPAPAREAPRSPRAVYEASRDGAATDAASLGRGLGLSAIAVGRALLALERRGLVDAGASRLTMKGLALAAALAAGRKIDLAAA